jgi:SpoIIAA-like
MMTSSVLEGTPIVNARYSGSLSAEEMTTLRGQVDSVIAAHGTARLLAEYGTVDLGRIEPKAVWEDLKMAGLLDKIERAALVTDSSLISAAANLLQWLAPTEVRLFDLAERDRALGWLRSEEPT